ncbi:hypothetical protein JQ636_24740 [Bradyrhizobium japonicum]|uniref:hypothetical protein n=1 Tax=Bradyrhizobium japonicum TaxID=375 RepID=UPI001BA68AE0|nr:hypothetical protein [Bradyrhizobium japonicum]MBR0806763.1 hypothetical protein [Bradyrhizobium japonicum]
MRKQFGFFAEASHFFGEPFFKGYGLRETASLKHGAAPFHPGKAGAQRAFLITVIGHVCDGDSVRPEVA